MFMLDISIVHGGMVDINQHEVYISSVGSWGYGRYIVQFAGVINQQKSQRGRPHHSWDGPSAYDEAYSKSMQKSFGPRTTATWLQHVTTMVL